MEILKRFVGTAIAGLALSLTGCGSGSDMAADDGSIRIMYIGQITDTANTTPRPEALSGVQAAVARVNADGGVNGKPLTLLTCDDKADANEAAKCAREAVREKVAATIGNNSNFGEAILAILERGNIASIGHLPITQSDFSSPVAFPLQAGSAGMIAGAARMLSDRGAKRIELAAVDSPAGSLNQQFATAGVEGTNTQIGALTLVPLDAPDYASYVAQVTRSGDAILLGMNSDQAGRFLQALAQADVQQPVAVTVGALPPEMVDQLGAAAEGRLVSAPLRPIPAGGNSNRQFLADMAEHQPDAKLNVFSQGGWLAVEAFARAMEANSVTNFSPANVLSVMSNLQNLDVGDMIPPLTTTQDLPAPYNRLFVNRVMFARVESGELRLIDEAWHQTLIR